MLDINYIKEHQDEVKKAIKYKKVKLDFTVEELLENYEQKRNLKIALEELRAQRNKLTDQIKIDLVNKDGLIIKATELKKQLQEKESKFDEVDELLSKQLLALPNVVDPNMPMGKDDSENVVIRKWGIPKTFDFAVKDHVDIGNNLDILDIDRAGKVTGARFVYLKN